MPRVAPEKDAAIDKLKAGRKGLSADWHQIGSVVGEVLFLTKRGDREKAVEAFAEQYQTYPNRVRQCIAAHRFVEALDDQKLAGWLKKEPVGVVDALASWYEFDPKTALLRAQEVIDGIWTYRGILAAGRAARAASSATPAALADQWRQLALTELLAGSAKGYTETTVEKALQNLPVDFWLRKKSRITAVRVLGPYPTRTDYARNLWANVAAALGLVQVGFDSWIVIPFDDVAERYRAALTKLAPTAPVLVVQLQLPPFETVTIKKRSRKPA